MAYNTLTQTEIKILEFFIVNRDKQFSIREISKQIKTAYPITYNHVKRLTNKNLISAEKQGKSTLCSFNYKKANKDVFYVEQIRAEKLLGKNEDIDVLIRDIKSKINYSSCILLLFGSFAKGTQDKQSDIDLLFVIPESEDVEKTERRIYSIVDIYPLKIHLVVVNEKSFKEMLAEKETNVVKEVINNHIILYGIENYYKLISQA